MNHLGNHLIIDFYECDCELLNDAQFIDNAMIEAAKSCGATIVSNHINRFNPHGISGVVVIAESHITIHTWPEHGYAAVDVFTCGSTVDPWLVNEYLFSVLKAKRSSVEEFKRGKFDLPVKHKPDSCDDKK